MGTPSGYDRPPDELPDDYVVVGKRCVVVQGDEVHQTWFTGRAWGGWRVDRDLLEGPVEVRVGTLDGARLLSGYAVLDSLGSVLQDLRVVAYRQDRAEVRVTRMGEFWVAEPGSSEWMSAQVRDLSASGASLLVPEPWPRVQLRGSVRTEFGHQVDFETTARLVRLDDSTVDELVVVYELDLDDAQRCALRAAVLWETSAKRG